MPSYGTARGNTRFNGGAGLLACAAGSTPAEAIWNNWNFQDNKAKSITLIFSCLLLLFILIISHQSFQTVKLSFGRFW
jgi:hypothetical protein